MTDFAPLGRCLLVVAAEIELEAVLTGLAWTAEPWHEFESRVELGPKFDVVCTGIGKANAAAAVASAADPARHKSILNLGIAGSLPGSGLNLRELVIATESSFSDEGVQTPDGFVPCHEMGFPIGNFPGAAVLASQQVMRRLSVALRSLNPRTAPIATVSTCSGTNELARTIQDRTGAIAECMEGAAVGLAAQRAGIPFAEVRVISNTTGDRNSQVWDLKGSLSVLSRIIGLLSESGSP